MDFSINTRPLLQISDSESDFDEDPQARRDEDNDVVIKACGSFTNTWIPADRYYISYVIFYFLGTIILLPWFFFVTAEEYWMYKFRPLDKSAILTESGRSELQARFTSYMALAATGPPVLFLIINPLISHKISLHIRVGGSLTLMLLLFIATTVLVKINTDSWQNEFFILTITIVVVINIASAILQSAVFGVVGRFPSRYIAATVSGQALGGIMAAVAQIVSLAVGASPILSALVYFIIADLFIFIAILAYAVLSSTLFFNYYTCRSDSEYAAINSQKPNEDDQSTSSPTLLSPPRQISYTNIIKKIWVHGFAVWFCFTAMFSVYPGIAVLVKPLNGNPDSIWNQVYFVPVVTFLLFSLCDYTGRLLAGLFEWPVGNNSGWKVAVMSLCRVVFVPMVMLANAQPRHHLPVFIMSDFVYVLIIVLFGITNGYVANITFLAVPKLCEPQEIEAGSSYMSAFLGIGLFTGSLINILMLTVI